MWYVIQTTTGAEQVLVELIHKIMPSSFYEDCFFLQRECVKKIGSGHEVYLAPMFPAYVFLVTNTPEEAFYELKKIPKLSKLLKGSQDDFLHVSEEEQVFLENIQAGNDMHIVQRSVVEVDASGQIVHASGAVGIYKDKIVKQRLRKRFVLIEQEFLGVKRKIVLGIKLKNEI